MGRKASTKPPTATAPKAKTKKVTRKPGLNKEEISLLIFGQEALIAQEEAKELLFAEQHLTTCRPNDEGENEYQPWAGTYSELVAMYKSYDRPSGSVVRTKATALIEKLKVLLNATKK